MTVNKPVDPVDWAAAFEFATAVMGRCDICGAPMENLTGPTTWQDTTECTACGWSPDDAWRVGR